MTQAIDRISIERNKSFMDDEVGVLHFNIPSSVITNHREYVETPAPVTSPVPEIEQVIPDIPKSYEGANANYYYSVRNHQELFSLGAAYLKNYRIGKKNFAFCHSGLEASSQKTIFGIAVFFTYHTGLPVRIVTHNFERSFYAGKIERLDVSIKTAGKNGVNYRAYTMPGIDFVEYSQLKDGISRLSSSGVESFWSEFVDSSEITLWDLPDLDQMDAQREIFFPIIRRLENVSLVVRMNRTKFGQIQRMAEYFKSYGIEMKGFVIDPDRKKGKRGGIV